MIDEQFLEIGGQKVKILTADGGLKLKPSEDEEVFFKIRGDEVDNMFDYFEIRVGYLEGQPVHIHSKQVETFHVLEGELTLRLGEELHVAHAGDFLLIPAGMVHTYANLKEGTVAKAVGNLAPGGFYKFVLEMAEYQKTHRPPNRDEIAAISAKYDQVFVGPPLAVSMGLRPAH